MIFTRDETQVVPVVYKVQCDVCKKFFDNEMDIQEMIRIRTTGGYGSVVGDMVEWHIDICETCFTKTFEQSIRVQDVDEEGRPVDFCYLVDLGEEGAQDTFKNSVRSNPNAESVVE